MDERRHPRERPDTLVIWQEARKGESRKAGRVSPAERGHSLEAPPCRLPGSPLLSSALGSARQLGGPETCRWLEKGKGGRPRVEEAPRSGRKGWVGVSASRARVGPVHQLCSPGSPPSQGLQGRGGRQRLCKLSRCLRTLGHLPPSRRSSSPPFPARLHRSARRWEAAGRRGSSAGEEGGGEALGSEGGHGLASPGAGSGPKAWGVGTDEGRGPRGCGAAPPRT